MTIGRRLVDTMGEVEVEVAAGEEEEEEAEAGHSMSAHKGVHRLEHNLVHMDSSWLSVL